MSNFNHIILLYVEIIVSSIIKKKWDVLMLTILWIFKLHCVFPKNVGPVLFWESFLILYALVKFDSLSFVFAFSLPVFNTYHHLGSSFVLFLLFPFKHSLFHFVFLLRLFLATFIHFWLLYSSFVKLFLLLFFFTEICHLPLKF